MATFGEALQRGLLVGAGGLAQGLESRRKNTLEQDRRRALSEALSGGVSAYQGGGRDALAQSLLGSGVPELQQAGLTSLMTQPKTRSPIKIREGAEKGMVSDVLLDPDTMQPLSRGEPYYASGTMFDYSPLMDGDGDGDGDMPMGGGPAPGQAPAGQEAPSTPAMTYSDQARQRAKQQEVGEEKIETLNDKIGQQSQMVKDLNRFVFLNQKNRTGGEQAIPGVGFFRSMADPEFKEMQAIQDRITPLMRQGMPGAASDRDVAMFRGATVSVDKPFETNQNIALAQQVALENMMSKSDFLTWHLQNRGTAGPQAEELWRRYLESNSIFDPNAPEGSYEINQDRMEWREWLEAGAPARERRQPTQSQSQMQRPPGLSDDEWQEYQELKAWESGRGR